MIGVACNNTSSVEQPTYVYKNLNFEINDTIALEGDTENIFSTYLYPIRFDSTELIAFDILTNNLLFFKTETFPLYHIDQAIDLQVQYQMYSSIRNKLVGVIEVYNNNLLIISDPYFLIVDRDLEIQKVFNFNIHDNITNYYITGDVTNIKSNEDRTCVYFTIAPGLPAKEENYFTSGRIAEVNLKTGNYRILPVPLPFDYEIGKNYEIFAMPNFTLHENYLYYIYPGSNYLYNYNLINDNIDSTFISPKHVEINVKEVGSNLEDLFSHLECNNFYQIISDDDLILLFYWKGKTRGPHNRHYGLKALDCYILGYKPDVNMVLFDELFETNNLLKKAYMFREGKLYFIYDDITKLNQLKTEILVYGLEIN